MPVVSGTAAAVGTASTVAAQAENIVDVGRDAVNQIGGFLGIGGGSG